MATVFYAFEDLALLFLSLGFEPNFSGDREFPARVF